MPGRGLGQGGGSGRHAAPEPAARDHGPAGGAAPQDTVQDITGDGHFGFCPLCEVDGDGVPEWVVLDSNYACWMSSFAESPAPAVILKYQDGRYRFAAQLMRLPPPPEAELAATVARVRDEFGKRNNFGLPPPELREGMLDLIYTGNYDVAMQFMDRAWLAGHGDKEEYRTILRDALRQSDWWPELRRMNRLRRALGPS